MWQFWTCNWVSSCSHDIKIRPFSRPRILYFIRLQSILRLLVCNLFLHSALYPRFFLCVLPLKTSCSSSMISSSSSSFNFTSDSTLIKTGNDILWEEGIERLYYHDARNWVSLLLVHISLTCLYAPEKSLKLIACSFLEVKYAWICSMLVIWGSFIFAEKKAVKLAVYVAMIISPKHAHLRGRRLDRYWVEAVWNT